MTFYQDIHRSSNKLGFYSIKVLVARLCSIYTLVYNIRTTSSCKSVCFLIMDFNLFERPMSSIPLSKFLAVLSISIPRDTSSVSCFSYDHECQCYWMFSKRSSQLCAVNTIMATSPKMANPNILIICLWIIHQIWPVLSYCFKQPYDFLSYIMATPLWGSILK